jgi:hypothetical protein
MRNAAIGDSCPMCCMSPSVAWADLPMADETEQRYYMFHFICQLDATFTAASPITVHTR